MAFTLTSAETASSLPPAPLAPQREARIVTPYQPAATVQQRLAARGVLAPSTPPPAASAPAADAPAALTLSPQVALLARKEQKFRQQQQDLATQRKTLEAEKAELAQLRAMKEKLAQKDYSGLEGLVNYDEYTDYAVKKIQGTSPEQQAIESLKTEIETVKKSQADNISKQFEAAVSERRTATQKLIQADTTLNQFKTKLEKEFPKAKLEELAVHHILDTWENDSAELPVEDAVKEVVEQLMERAKRWATLLEQHAEEIKQDAPAVEEKKPLPPLRPALKTITNQVTTGEIKSPPKSMQFMSDTERWAEARRRAVEKLKSQQPA
jgi:hypothetical protein